MADVPMPRLSDTMEEGTILKWLKEDGAEVARGEEIAEIETDKATMTYEADQDGTLTLVASEGDTLPVGETIARIGAGSGERQVASAPEPAAEPAPAPPPPPPPADDNDERIKASPVAKRMAREQGIELSGVHGSGPGGRIVKADVEAAGDGGALVSPAPPASSPAPPAPTAPPAAPATPPAPAGLRDGATAKGEVIQQELNRAQQVVARRMAESKATAPDFALDVEVDMTAAVQLRTRLKALARSSEHPAPSVNDLVVKAAALALREFPRANGAYRDGRFELYSRVNVGIAVAGQDALVVPTVFDADRKSLGEIARESRALSERARTNAVTPPELSGGTFTVSNLGMYGVGSFTAVINPPQAAILSVGSLAERPVVRDGALAVAPTMALTLACDHRILYGADAAQFLGRIRELLEQPLAMAL